MTDQPHTPNGETSKAVSARVQVINEAVHPHSEDWQLCFQWCRYIYGDGTMETGYRFIWRRPNGRLQAARGQARIPSLKIAGELMEKAVEEGWGQNDGG